MTSELTAQDVQVCYIGIMRISVNLFIFIDMQVCRRLSREFLQNLMHLHMYLQLLFGYLHYVMHHYLHYLPHTFSLDKGTILTIIYFPSIKIKDICPSLKTPPSQHVTIADGFELSVLLLTHSWRHKMFKTQVESRAQRVISLQSFEHFMTSRVCQ